MTYNQQSRQYVAQSDAALVEPPRLPRSRFNNQFQRLTAFDAGYIVPFLCDMLYPGDHVTYTTHPYVRLSTPLFPLFSNQRVDIHYFATPMRILWDNFKKFQGEQATPASSIAYTIPQVSPTGGAAIGSLTDHLGIPYLSGQIDATSVWSASAMWHRAYNRIYNEWYRDENIIDSRPENTGNGPDALADYVMQRRAKQHDYITSMLPWPQKFTAPTIPLIGNAPVTGIGAGSTAVGGGVGVNAYETDKVAATAYVSSRDFNTAAGNMQMWAKTVDIGGGNGYRPAIYADLSAVAGVSVNQLRQAWMIQQLLERDARSGTRYTERLKGVWGVDAGDARMQRPEYIGGGQIPLGITAIAQTAPTAGAPLGALGAAGTAAGRCTATFAAKEHTIVLGLISVRTELGYDQGLDRMFSELTRLDMYEPSLAQLGEQAVLRKEVYAKGSFVPGSDDTIIGYQERWQHLRTKRSDATGVMRTFATGTLSAWHLYQKFIAAPTLNAALIEDNPPMDRVLAAGALAAGQQYIADIQTNRSITRILPTYGTPALLGRF